MIIKSILIEKETNIIPYKDEYFLRAKLTFLVTVLGFFNFRKSINYDVTMFQDFKSYEEYWDNLITNKTTIPYNLINDNIIFEC